MVSNQTLPVNHRGPASWLQPQWAQPVHGVHACMTTRMPMAGCAPSASPFDSFNLGDHVGDDAHMVLRHRQRLAEHMQAEAVWLQQVHESKVVRLSRVSNQLLADGQPCTGPSDAPVVADGACTTEPGIVCTVMVADCLPVLLVAQRDGVTQGVAALHAGWRGAVGGSAAMQGVGVLERGVQALCEATGCMPHQLQAWLGACIGPQAFEVGEAVWQACQTGGDQQYLIPKHDQPGKWWCDLAGLAKHRLARAGVHLSSGGQWCTVSEPAVFFSYRRDGVTGRQAACICM